MTIQTELMRAWRLVCCATILGLAACTSPSGEPSPTPVAPASTTTLPPAGGRFSYQIGGAYPPDPSVRIVGRDHSVAPDRHRYSICYVNAFQGQAEDLGWWQAHHSDLLLHDGGKVVIDENWGEPLLDISTATKRAALMRIVGAWFDECARRGYRAIEADNLDTYTRSNGLLTAADALAYGRLLVARAHRLHLALAQKNASELSRQAHRAGFDFAIAESCQVYSECGAYTSVYGRHVIEIEYSDAPFAKACKARGTRVSVVRRDVDVTQPGKPGHVERWCSH